jgi:hypothetical protein
MWRDRRAGSRTFAEGTTNGKLCIRRCRRVGWRLHVDGKRGSVHTETNHLDPTQSGDQPVAPGRVVNGL